MAVSFPNAWGKNFKVQLSGEKLTILSEDEPLTKILKKISEQGIRVRIDPQIQTNITASFDNRPVGPALKSILKSLDYALIWQANSIASGKEPQLQEIRIFRPGLEKNIQDLPGYTNLEIVKNGDGTYHVKDILLLQVAPDISKAAFQAILDQTGGTLLDVHLPLGLVKLRLPEGVDISDVAATLSQYQEIKSAEPDFAYPVKGSKHVIGTSPAEPINTNGQPSPDSTVMAVVDSGLHADYLDSPFVAGAYDAVSPDAQKSDALGHGTQMTLVAAGAVTPKGIENPRHDTSQVVSIRGIDDNGYTSNYTLINGIDYAIEMGAEVMSLSWGSSTPSAMLESAAEYALNNGIILVAAAGNEPTGEPVYPAAYDNVIGVGALTDIGEPWSQSNYGDFIDVQAPGMADLPVGFKGDPGMYVGTSIATAYTARVIAEILEENPKADLEEVIEKLKSKNEIK